MSEKREEEESFVCLVIEDDTPSSHGSTDTKSLDIYTVTKRAAAAYRHELMNPFSPGGRAINLTNPLSPPPIPT